MTKLFQTCILLVMLSLASGYSFGQVTYTTNGSCLPGHFNYFGDASCWTKVSDNCIPSAPLVPPVSGPTCPITIIINHQINLSTFNFGTNVNVIVNSGGIWNISGNVTQTAQAVSSLVIDGGQVNVTGSFLLSSGNLTNNTTLRIETINSGNLYVVGTFNTRNFSLVEFSGDESGALNTGIFEIGNNSNLNLNSGGIINVSGNFNLRKPNTATINLNGGELNIAGTLDISIGSSGSGILNISGNGTGKSITTNLINLRSNATVNVLENGSLIVNGITRYNGNSAKMNVYGYFETLALEIIGGTALEFNTYGSANVVVETNVTVGGGSTISFGGDSVVEIGGSFIVNGGTVNIGPDADVFVCGTVDQDVDDLVDDGLIIPQCILPVEYIYIESQYSKESNAALLTWATSKEWENSRFEIERSVGGISDFVKVGEVQGMGWKDSITEYEYMDRNLPLIGGNVYYRLKQVDLNGEYSLSKVMSVKINGVQFTEGVWRAYPNPTDGSQFRISLLDPAQYNQEKITFRIIHPTSVSRVVLVNSENEMNEALARMIGNIPKGVFVVELRWGQKIEHIKVLRKR